MGSVGGQSHALSTGVTAELADACDAWQPQLRISPLEVVLLRNRDLVSLCTWTERTVDLIPGPAPVLCLKLLPRSSTDSPLPH